MNKKLLNEYENPKAWGIVRDLCHQIESGQLDDKIPEIMDEINNFTPPTETRYLWVNCYEESCDMDRELMKSLERRINQLKLNENMKKNKIRLTESQLHRVIKESVKRVLKENSGGMQAYADNTYKHKFIEKYIHPLYQKIEQGIEQGDILILAKCYQEIADLITNDEIKYQGLFVDLLDELHEKRNILANEMVRIVKSNV